MLITVDYSYESEVHDIINEYKELGCVLKEVQNHFDGKHLVFEVPLDNIEGEVLKIRKRVANLERIR